MKKALIFLAIVLILVFGLSMAFAAPSGGQGPKCPNPGGNSNGVCAKLGPCKGAAIDTAKILPSSFPLRVCVFGG
jgi:hypothetical protein